MNKTEELLQELVDMKRKEIRRKKISSILVFVFITLPTFILIVLSIYGSVILYQKAQDALSNLPETAQNYQKDFLNNIKSGLQN